MDDFLEYVQGHLTWIITLASLTVALASFWINKRRGQKELGFQVLTRTPLVSRKKGVLEAGKIQVLYDGRPVEDVWLMEMELRNFGGKEIEAKDFERPLQFVFPDGMGLLDPAVARAFPANFMPDIEVDGSAITLKPTLMNPGDWFVIRLLVTAQGEFPFRIDARISGVRNVQNYAAIRNRRENAQMLFGAAGMTALIMVIIGITTWWSFQPGAGPWPMVIGMLCAMAPSITYLVWTARKP